MGKIDTKFERILRLGETKNFKFNILESDESAFDLTDVTVTLVLERDGVIFWRRQCTVSVPVDGVATVQLATAGLPIGLYTGRLWLLHNNYTLSPLEFRIRLEDVPRLD